MATAQEYQRILVTERNKRLQDLIKKMVDVVGKNVDIQTNTQHEYFGAVKLLYVRLQAFIERITDPYVSVYGVLTVDQAKSMHMKYGGLRFLYVNPQHRDMFTRGVKTYKKKNVDDSRANTQISCYKVSDINRRAIQTVVAQIMLQPDEVSLQRYIIDTGLALGLEQNIHNMEKRWEKEFMKRTMIEMVYALDDRMMKRWNTLWKSKEETRARKEREARERLRIKEKEEAEAKAQRKADKAIKKAPKEEKVQKKEDPKEENEGGKIEDPKEPKKKAPREEKKEQKKDDPKEKKEGEKMEDPKEVDEQKNTVSKENKKNDPKEERVEEKKEDK